MVKFLVIRFSSIGDIVLSTPVIRCLKEQVENAEVHFLTKKNFRPVLSHNPYISKIHILENSLSDLLPALKNENFDYVIDLHHNLRTAIVKAKIGTISFSVKKLNFEKWLMVNFKINKLPRKHIVDRYMDTIQLFDVSNDHHGLDFFYSTSDEFNPGQLPEQFHSGYVAFIIGAKHATKKLPREKISSIVHLLNLPVVLVGGKEDMETGDWIRTNCNGVCENMAGKLSLGQSASLVKNASVVITHDTGMMHIAAAFHRKIISIWGNTIPEFGMYPYVDDTNSAMVEVSDLTCRPCSKIGFEKCPKKHFKCMNLISNEKICELARKMFADAT